MNALNMTFEERWAVVKSLKNKHYVFVETKLVTKKRQLPLVHKKHVEEGHEGTMIRDRFSVYEVGQRSNYLLKVLSIHKQISRSALEKEARKIAERLSELFGVSSPEFSDKNVFATLINGLRENELVTTNEQGSLMLNDASENLQEIVDKLVWPEVVQHLEKLD